MKVRAEQLFISDLHLQDQAGVTMLADWVDQHLATADALYILGDLFEAWIGDDDDDPLGQAVAQLLGKLSAAGCRVAFLPGNRDFLLGREWLERCGAELLSEPVTVPCQDRSLLLLHGDLECTADLAYQKFRQQVRAPEWRQAFLTQSLDSRRQFAARARAQSREHTQSTSAYLMDADADALQQRLDQSGARVLVHGHTHRPAIHALHGATGPALRLVLGAWHRQPSWLVASADGLRLHAEGLSLRADWPG